MKNTLLLVTHVVMRKGPNGYLIDDQTAAGIAQWCKYFDRITFYGIAERIKNNSSSIAWVDINSFKGTEKCELLALPAAYQILKMCKEYRSVRATLNRAVRDNENLCFTIGGLIGDWPAIGALEAIRQKKKFSAWIDRVEPLVLKNKIAHGSSSLKRLAAKAFLPVMETYTKHLLRHSSVALLQGLDTFNHYAAFTAKPHCTYDTHTTKDDQISSTLLFAKMERITAGKPLNILYVGRADVMKGPADWLNVLKGLDELGIPFQATWIGDGPALKWMVEKVRNLGLREKVLLPGFEGNRQLLLDNMQKSDFLLYCHKTPESPRNLIEALVSGCPIVGYESAYPKGLVEKYGGGVFVAQDNVKELITTIIAFCNDRATLCNLVKCAALSGEIYNEDAVYAHRAEIMLSARST
jgi:colanic acid/amylovoran biosynthesis glycosyltransferase